MNWLDERRADQQQNFMGISNMYVNLSDDFKRLDEKAEVKSFPRDTSGIEDLNSLNVQWEEINQINLSITDMDAKEVITVNGAKHVSRLTTSTVWRSRDLALKFLKLCLARPSCLWHVGLQSCARVVAFSSPSH